MWVFPVPMFHHMLISARNPDAVPAPRHLCPPMTSSGPAAAVWKAGTTVEAKWGLRFNHGGGGC